MSSENKKNSIPLAAIEVAKDLKAMHDIDAMDDILQAHIGSAMDKLSEVNKYHQKIKSALENVASELTAAHEVVSIDIGTDGEASILMNVTPNETLDVITVDFEVKKDECPICVFEERFHALMEEVD